MRKVFLFAFFATITMLVSCSKNNETPYMWFVKVTNETDREIVITNKTTGNELLKTAIIAPKLWGTTEGVLFYGSSKSKELQPDNLTADEILPFGNATTMQLPEGEYWLEMTIGGDAVSGEVWKRKHWSFEPNTTDRWYSLTVTDAFLENLTP